MKKYKYIVCDEDGPIRVFYSKEEAQNFLQKDWTIQVVKIGKPPINFNDFEEALFWAQIAIFSLLDTWQDGLLVYS